MTDNNTEALAPNLLPPTPAPESLDESVQRELDRIVKAADLRIPPKVSAQIDGETVSELTAVFAETLSRLGPVSRDIAKKTTGHFTDREFDVFCKVWGVRTAIRDGVLIYCPARLAEAITRSIQLEIRERLC